MELFPFKGCIEILLVSIFKIFSLNKTKQKKTKRTSFKVNWYLPCFSAIFSKGDNFCVFLFASLDDEAFLKLGSTLKGKNLLLGEQILPFKS